GTSNDHRADASPARGVRGAAPVPRPPRVGLRRRNGPARGRASGTRGQGGKPPRGAAVPCHGHRGGGRRTAGGPTAYPASGGRASRADEFSPTSYVDRGPDGS